MKKYDIIVTGDCNIDLIFNNFNKLPHFGEEVIAHDFDIVLGSSAGITAAHLAALGVNVAYIGSIGADSFGQQFKELLGSYGVCTNYMIEKKAYKTGCTVVMSKDEDRANLTHAGAMAQLSPQDIPFNLIASTPYFHMSNPYVLPHFRDVLPQFFKAIKKHQVHTSLDPQWDVEEKWDTDLRQLLPYVDVFLPNETELQLLLKGNNTEVKSLLQQCTTQIISTCGSHGVQHIDSQSKRSYPAYQNAHPIDCIGAGDAFTAGFLSGIIENKSSDKAIEMGCKSGALSTTVAGGSVPYTSRQDFEKLFRQFINP
ncbi:carbohydrate kinase family protein [Carboxylicivirga sediminis]|uniref:Carbohydrate kinase family protein n=1 Tax=Carboxylicivirga sediminis TaxID=2006564 RepID=A0A941F541_9BACT|nr:carbohydrate kinase family protein [Carboxylicivirga sediminis]MBR8536119.1 carbohydrate kinase family protein [Carboxylicivirga sediminis]